MPVPRVFSLWSSNLVGTWQKKKTIRREILGNPFLGKSLGGVEVRKWMKNWRGKKNKRFEVEAVAKWGWSNQKEEESETEEVIIFFFLWGNLDCNEEFLKRDLREGEYTGRLDAKSASTIEIHSSLSLSLSEVWNETKRNEERVNCIYGPGSCCKWAFLLGCIMLLRGPLSIFVFPMHCIFYFFLPIYFWIVLIKIKQD